jgi:hypothetical protein
MWHELSALVLIIATISLSKEARERNRLREIPSNSLSTVAKTSLRRVKGQAGVVNLPSFERGRAEKASTHFSFYADVTAFQT